jgi:hypothetical protein
MKLPSSLGQKKVKAVEQMLQEVGIEITPGEKNFYSENPTIPTLRRQLLLTFKILK